MARLLVASCCLLLTHGFVWAASVAVYVDQQGGLFDFTRPDVVDPISALTALATPPTAAEAGQELSSGVLPGTKVLALQTNGDTTTIEFSLEIIGGGLDETRLTAIFEQVKATLRQFGQDGSVRLQAGGKLLSDYLPPVKRVEPNPVAKAIEPKAVGALAGKTIGLGPSHGRFWNGSGWYWQRSDPCGFGEAVLEDCNSVRLAQFLATYLAQDGATPRVYRDLNETDCCHSATGLPWWKMAARYWLEHSGYPASVYDSSDTDLNDDIRSRPLAADYDSTDIYLAMHSNAGGGGTGTGTETYRDTAMEHPAWESASLTLANSVQSSVVSTIRSYYDATWADRGVKDSAGGFGEIRIPNRPAVLIELAFHDNCTRDALYLKDNFFRSTCMWAYYKGICNYFGVTPTWAYYSDEIVSHDIPTSMNPGATATVHITFRNRGVLWNDTRGFQLGAVGDSDPFTTTTRYVVGGEVGPNTTKTFTLTFTAPTTPGTYTTDWRILRSGVTWFGATLSVSVNVGETGYAATWGPYDLTTSQCIYYPANSSSSLRTGWYTTTSGTGAARNVFKAADSYMATMPDASIVSGSSFTATWSAAGTYSVSLDNPLNIYRIGQAWTSAAVWNSPWSAGGDYSSVGTSSQPVVYPTNSPLYTFSVGAGYNFPYGVMMKGDSESGISYRKGWLASGPYPTLSVSYTTPTPTIRSWAYLGWYDQGATTDRQLRIDTDQVTGTYGGVTVTEADIAPKVGGTSYGNSYGTRQWQQGAYTNDLVNLNSSCFYNAVHENAVTYCCVYVYNSKGSSITGACLGIGSDDGCKVWWNGTVVGSDVVGRGVAADSDFWGPVTINNGWNRLMVKVENGGAGHGVYARFANANRTALTDKSYLSFYTTDATAPSVPTSLAVSGVTSGVWQNTVAAPTLTWTSGTDSQGSGQGVSGVRGQKYYFGTSSSGSPGTFQTDVSYAPGTQADGAYYFKVDTVDYALNESSAATFTFLYDATAPTGVSMGFGTITTDSITVTGSGTDAHSGINAAAGYNYSRAGATNSGAKSTTHTWTGLDTNTEYTDLLVTVSDQASPTPNTAASSAQSKWTLSVPPAAGSVTPDQASPRIGSNVTWTAVNGFGPGQVQYYRYAWDTTPTHIWTETEAQWLSGTIATVPNSAGIWYLHIKGYNGGAVGNGTFDYSVTTSVVYSQTNAVSSMVNNGDGTFTLNFVGTPQAKYYVVTSPDPWTLMSGWTVLPNSTNTAPSPSGIWSVTATNNASQRFYRSAAVDPAP